jgi:hypothetical protein
MLMPGRVFPIGEGMDHGDDSSIPRRMYPSGPDFMAAGGVKPKK